MIVFRKSEEEKLKRQNVSSLLKPVLQVISRKAFRPNAACRHASHAG